MKVTLYTFCFSIAKSLKSDYDAVWYDTCKHTWTSLFSPSSNLSAASQIPPFSAHLHTVARNVCRSSKPIFAHQQLRQICLNQREKTMNSATQVWRALESEYLGSSLVDLWSWQVPRGEIHDCLMEKKEKFKYVCTYHTTLHHSLISDFLQC